MKTLLVSLVLLMTVSCGKSNKRDVETHIGPQQCRKVVCIDETGYEIGGTYYYYQSGPHYLGRKCYCHN